MLRSALRYRTWAFLIALLVLATACAGGVARPQGWAGGVIDEDTNVLYVGTMEGRLLAIDLNGDGSPIARFELTGDDNKRAIYGNPYLVDGAIFVGGYDGFLYSISASPSGEELSLNWKIEVSPDEPLVGGPVASDGVVVVGSSDGYVYAFDIVQEREIWRYQTGNKIWATPSIKDGIVYIGSLDKNLYALKLFGTDSQVGERLLWKFSTGGAITAKPLVMDGRVYFGSFDSTFYALNAVSGREHWKFEGSRNWYWTGAIADGQTLFVPSMDRKLYALDATTGQVKWTLETDGDLTGSPVVLSRWIAVPSDDGALYIANLSNGGNVEKCEIGARLRSDLVAVAQQDTVYVNTWDHSTVAVTVKENGRPDSLWRHITNKDKWKQDWRDTKGGEIC